MSVTISDVEKNYARHKLKFAEGGKKKNFQTDFKIKY